jgi:transcriptional regulator with XRE-family HTH domain
MDVSVSPAERLRTLRTGRGLSQRELGFFAGCSHVTISRLEKGELRISAGLKVQIARALGVPVQELWDAPSSEA